MTSSSSSRPVTADFDAGINTSAAWTEHLDAASLSDEEHEQLQLTTRSARALYAFEGKPEFRELTVDAGDDLDVVKEVLPDGWSLVRTVVNGQVGLLPRTYYTFTSEFVSTPENSPPKRKEREATTESVTPRGSPGGDKHIPLPIVPQNTGEWLPSFRRSLLGGKSLNRFSSFVTSGAEAWVLNGTSEDDANPPTHTRTTTESEDTDDRFSRLGQGEADKHYVDTGPAWKSKIPPFKILVHSPSKRSSVLSGAYTIYDTTSLFSPDDPYDPPPSSHHNRLHSEFIPRSYFNPEEENEEATPEPLQRLTVHRRFSHFVILHTALTRRLPGIALPPLPEKQYSGRFNDDFIEARRGDLERYINKIVRHPIARYAEIVTFFLSCENDSEWKSSLPKYTSLPPAGPSFYAKIYHPLYNVDCEDASHASATFPAHVKAVSRSVQGLRGIFSKVRDARLEMAKAERGLGYALLGMITSPFVNGSGAGGLGRVDEEEEEEHHEEGDGQRESTGCKGVVNNDGAWCWREECQECLRLTKGIQKLSETLQSVADLYDDHARRTQLATHESLKSLAHPDAIYEPIITTHKSTLSRYKDALNESDDNKAKADLASRCETVLNTTMAEMDIYHSQKVEDFERLTREHLDGEIRVYEQILTRLRSARATLTPPTYNALSDTPITPSLYTRDLFPSPSPSQPPSSYPFHTSILTTHKFIPTSPPPTPAAPTSPSSSYTSTAGALGIGEVLIPPLPQPTPHVFDSAPMRPVSVAVKGGVGVVVGVVEGVGAGLRFGRDGSGGERGSVFGRLWS
ncbi:PX-domain-containing protein [Macrolepiota fuliginosa MF-IS2]|uniref:PX-domain-containing protein n=1 Tax=Macrolepiota fuliginosa MF-IS2 TaxID=1400762 RepID=A0A9P6C1M5_9AGAR|nr:PX-domain-containing protein [Macrolepiota fuliginosa MF-IS2]